MRPSHSLSQSGKSFPIKPEAKTIVNGASQKNRIVPSTNRNDDGSVDLYFSPGEPEGKAANWVPTRPGRPWFSYFRLYGPLEAYFDKSWKLGDFTAAQDADAA